MASRSTGESHQPKLLRERHRQLTQELILETFAQMVVEDGLHDVSIQQVADRVGVSHRTVYRHFKNRQDLVDRLADWLDERLAARGGIDLPETAEDVPQAVELNYRLFDEEAELVKALATVTWGQHGSLASAQDRRTTGFSNFLKPHIRHLTPVQARAIAAIFRYLASSQSWLVFRERFGISGTEMGPTLGWAFQVLFNSLSKQSAGESDRSHPELDHDH